MDAAVHQALLEATDGALAAEEAAAAAAAAAAAEQGAEPGARPSLDLGARRIDFDHFLCLLREPSGAINDLDNYDDR